MVDERKHREKLELEKLRMEHVESEKRRTLLRAKRAELSGKGLFCNRTFFFCLKAKFRALTGCFAVPLPLAAPPVQEIEPSESVVRVSGASDLQTAVAVSSAAVSTISARAAMTIPPPVDTGNDEYAVEKQRERDKFEKQYLKRYLKDDKEATPWYLSSSAVDGTHDTHAVLLIRAQRAPARATVSISKTLLKSLARKSATKWRPESDSSACMYARVWQIGCFDGLQASLDPLAALNEYQRRKTLAEEALAARTALDERPTQRQSDESHRSRRFDRRDRRSDDRHDYHRRKRSRSPDDGRHQERRKRRERVAFTDSAPDPVAEESPDEYVEATVAAATKPDKKAKKAQKKAAKEARKAAERDEKAALLAKLRRERLEREASEKAVVKDLIFGSAACLLAARFALKFVCAQVNVLTRRLSTWTNADCRTIRDINKIGKRGCWRSTVDKF